MGYALPNGSTMSFAIPGASPVAFTAVAGVEDIRFTTTGAQFKVGDTVLVQSDFANINGLVLPVVIVNGNTVIATQAKGAGVPNTTSGTLTVISEADFKHLPNITSVANAGADQQTTTIQPVSSDGAIELKTIKSAASQTLTIARAGLVDVWDDLVLADDTDAVTVFRLRQPRVKEDRYYAATISVGRIPTTTVNEIETVTVTAFMLNKLVQVPHWGMAYPEPDVIIPLTESLMLTKGYSEAVTFSRATAATFIDENNVLQLVGANVPRFEKGALLVEGGSTNVAPRSEGWGASQAGDAWVTTVTPDNWQSLSAKTLGTPAEPGYADVVNTAALAPDTQYTFSLDIKYAPDLDCRFSLFGMDNTAGSASLSVSAANWNTVAPPGWIITRLDGWMRITATRTTISPNTRIFRIYPNISADFSTRRNFIYRRLQAEALGIDSSYIPTNGAAASRAPDIPRVTSLRNVAEGNTPVTIAVISSPRVGAVAGAASRVLQIGTDGAGSLRLFRPYAEYISLHSGNPAVMTNTMAAVGLRKISAVIGAAKQTLYVDDVANETVGASPQNRSGDIFIGCGDVVGSNHRQCWGHIKSVTIWNGKELTGQDLANWRQSQ